MAGALCLATDLGMGFPFEHGLHTTLIAMRLADRLGVDREALHQTYYACLLSHSGCTTDAHVTPEVFGDSLTTQFHPLAFGSATRGPDRADAHASRPGQHGPAARGAGRPPVPENGAGDARAPRRRVRGGRDAGCGARPFGVGSRPPRLPAGALGRHGPAPPFARRGDPAADADRPARLGCRVPTPARRRGARCAPGPRARGTCVRPGAGRLSRRRRRADPRARRAGVGMGGDARLRAAPAAVARRRGARSRARHDGQLRGPDLAVPGRSLGGRRGARHRSGATLPDRCRGHDHAAACGVGPRPRAGRDRGADLAEARTAERRRMGAGAPPPVPHRARPLALTVPGGARAGRRSAPRASRRLRLPPCGHRRGACAACTPARGRRRLPRDDRAAPAPGPDRARAGGGDPGRGSRRRTPRRRRASPPSSRRRASGRRGSSARQD